MLSFGRASGGRYYVLNYSPWLKSHGSNREELHGFDPFQAMPRFRCAIMLLVELLHFERLL